MKEEYLRVGSWYYEVEVIIAMMNNTGLSYEEIIEKLEELQR